MNNNIPKFVPLNFAVGTLISRKDVDDILAEAKSYPLESRENKAFMAYARNLEEKLENQNLLAGK